ncbi:MAG: hypothetical protein PHD21_01580 [Flavobacteriales bacterium]|nr:hypothetical protein [Flavobacteriales bacterium]
MNRQETDISYFFGEKHPFAQPIIDSAENVWEIPSMLHLFFENTPLSSSFSHIKENIWAEQGAVIEDGAQIEGFLAVGANTTIKRNTVLRGYNIIGRECTIGNFVEIKNSLLFNGVQIPHLSYVGDSVLGTHAHLGAGAKISNFKSYGNEISITFSDEKVNTHLIKLGAVLGDNVEIGCNAVLFPGTMIGKESVIYPLTAVRDAIDYCTIVKSNGKTVKKQCK